MRSREIYWRLLTHVKPYAHIFTLSLLGTVIVAITDPMIAALIRPLLDGSFIAKDPYSIRIMPLLLVATFTIRGIADFTNSVAMNWVAQKVVMDLRAAIFSHLLLLPSSYFDDHPTSSIISRFTYDVTQVTTATTQALVTIVRDGLAVVGLIFWIFYLNWKLSLLAILIATGTGCITYIISKRLRFLSKKLQDLMCSLTYLIDEIIHNQKIIKVFGGQNYEKKRFNEINNRVRQFHLKIAATSEGSGPLVQMLAIFALSMMIYIASMQSVTDKITVGGLVSLFSAMAMLLTPIKRLTKVNEQLQRGLAGAETVFGLLDTQPEIDKGTYTLGKARGLIKFNSVSYRYRNKIIIKNCNLEVKPGEIIALVGPSGSGKTTLISLIPRFYELNEGIIYLDGISTKELKLEELRANIAYVSQETFLFNDTVAANIAYANADVQEEKLIQAAEDSYAMEFIRQLPKGFQTLIGENGVFLSGGQRQRLAIARAIFKDAPILILDEATSALDAQSEHWIRQALNNLQKNRTTFLITHRLATIENADRIIVLNQGNIVEVGTHNELLICDGAYANLYSGQKEIK